MNKQMLKSINLRKLRAVGVIPGYIDSKSSNSKLDALISRVPFSRHYKYYTDYKNDTLVAQNLMLNNEEIPDELFNKLKEVADELGLV